MRIVLLVIERVLDHDLASDEQRTDDEQRAYISDRERARFTRHRNRELAYEC
ncbi:MAG: hypothetical protein QM831_31835 [Kofleriaceae bacterium]